MKFIILFVRFIIISTKCLFVSDIALIKALTESSSSSSKALKQQQDHEIAMQNNTARIAQEAQERMNAFQLAQILCWMQLCSVEDRNRVRVSKWREVKVVSDVLVKFKKKCSNAMLIA